MTLGERVRVYAQAKGLAIKAAKVRLIEAGVRAWEQRREAGARRAALRSREDMDAMRAKRWRDYGKGVK